MNTLNSDQPLVTVQSRKYDGRIKRSWRARLVHREGALIILEGTFEEEVRHALLGTIAAGTHSTEFFYTDRWYSVFCFREMDGRLRNFYGNINTPVLLEDGILSFIDLDIDVLVTPDFSYTILDEDEFNLHASQLNYPDQFSIHAFEALEKLLTLINRREFPFDAQTVKLSLLNGGFGR